MFSLTILILILLITYKLTILSLLKPIPKPTPKLSLTLLPQTTFLAIFQATHKAVEGTVPSFLNKLQYL